MSVSDQLKELHDTYTWEVNAAVGEGRLDLVWQLADDYFEHAVALMTDDEPLGCGRSDCAVCQGARTAPVRSRRRWWSRRGRGAAAG